MARGRPAIGSFLGSAPVDVTVERPTDVITTPLGLVRACLSAHPGRCLGCVEIARVTGLPYSKVHYAVKVLRGQGLVLQHRAPGAHHRSQARVYQWVG